MARRRLPAVLVAFALAAFGVLVAMTEATAAFASCALNPPRSPGAFTGVVTATSSRDRVATVRTDAGATVTVRGTPATEVSMATSIDRTFEVGGRYEFHPVNTTSPFEDNDCTATRLLSRGAAPAPADETPAQPGESTAGATRAWALMGWAAVLGGLATGALVWRRSRRRAPLRSR